MRIRDFAKIYFAIVLVHLAALDVGESIMLIRFTKPLMLASLLVFYISHTSGRKFYEKLFVGALAFSLLGDIFLMFDNETNLLFLFGLGSFLITHILYAFSFYKELGGEKGFLQKTLVFTFLMVAFGVAFYVFLQPLPELFIVPVAIYVVGIILAWNSAINRLSVVPDKSFWFVLIGISLFVFSDSIIAITTFKEPFEHGPVLILASYFIGQFLITWGMLYTRLEDQ